MREKKKKEREEQKWKADERAKKAAEKAKRDAEKKNDSVINRYSRTSVIRPSVIRNLDYPIRAGSSIRLIRNTFLSSTHALTKEISTCC